jgi:AcrR family transcriptional regulator
MSAWLREERTDAAEARILDAAAAVFVERGVAGVGMAEIARAAGCSRATLYRYFDSRETLRMAFVEREAQRVAARVALAVAGVEDETERLVAAVVTSVAEVRADPVLAAWFTPGDLGVANRLAASSEVIDTLAVGLLGGPEHRDAARYLVRVIVSLLTMPGTDPDDERRTVERFVAPAVLGAPVGGGPGQ